MTDDWFPLLAGFLLPVLITGTIGWLVIGPRWAVDIMTLQAIFMAVLLFHRD